MKTATKSKAVARARDGYFLAAGTLGRLSVRHVWQRCHLVLTFHRVLPLELKSRYPLPGLAVTPEELAWIVDSLGDFFEIQPVSDASKLLKTRRPERPLLSFTFDDGQWDNLEYAVPVLESRGIKGTFYVPTEQIGSDELLWHDEAAFWWKWSDRNIDDLCKELPELRPEQSVGSFVSWLKTCSPLSRRRAISSIRDVMSGNRPDWARLMTWSEVQELGERGHEIGSHSKSHELLPQLSVEEADAEICESRALIQQATGILPRSFCYPNGSYADQNVLSVESAGYENAVTTQWGVNRAGRNSFELLRCDMDSSRLTDGNGCLSRNRLFTRLSGYQPNLSS